MSSGATSPTKARGRWLRLPAAALGVLLVGVIVGWAGGVVFTPPDDVLASSRYTTVAVAPGEVSSSVNVSVVARWTSTVVGSNKAAGTVTTVDLPAGGEAVQGTRLYSVDLRPVVVAHGDIPAFRQLSRGATGPDVTQLQAMLAALGDLQGAADGVFDARTGAAVKRWQKAAGVPSDGVVQVGDIVFVPELPVRLILDPAIARGALLGGGENAISALEAVPDFSIPATVAQASMAPAGTQAEIVGPSGEAWSGIIESQQPNEDGSVTLKLQHDSPPCGEECANVPVGDETLLAARLIVLSPVKGLVVPTAALTTDALGTVSVTDSKARAHPVEVVASAKGMSVVTGVQEGTRVRIPAESKSD